MVLTGNTFMSRQHAPMHIRDHRLSFRNNGLGICNNRFGIPDRHIGIDCQLGL